MVTHVCPHCGGTGYSANIPDRVWRTLNGVYLTPSEGILLAALRRHRGQYLRDDYLFNLIYGADCDTPVSGLKIMQVFICKLRAKLRGSGEEIERMRSHGYRLLPLAVADHGEVAA